MNFNLDRIIRDASWKRRLYPDAAVIVFMIVAPLLILIGWSIYDYNYEVVSARARKLGPNACVEFSFIHRGYQIVPCDELGK